MTHLLTTMRARCGSRPGSLIHIALLAGFIATHLACNEFETTSLPIVELGKGALPLEEGEYALFLSPTGSAPLQTGIYLERVEEHYRVRYLSTAKTTLSLAVVRGVEGFDEAEMGKAALPESEADSFEQLGQALEMMVTDAPGGPPPSTASSPEQLALLKDAAGFSLGALESGYFVYQTPATFLPSRWPATEKFEKPMWWVRVAKVERTSLDFYESAVASASASKAIFGTHESCKDGKCEAVLNVTDFTDTAELNRQIVLRAVHDFKQELKFKYRLVRSQTGS